MRADNRGEGGTLVADGARAERARPARRTCLVLGIAGAALFSGDAMITPAISVLSAVEGLKLVTHGVRTITCCRSRFVILDHAVSGQSTAQRASPPSSVRSWSCFSRDRAFSVSAPFGDAPRILHAFDPAITASFLFTHGYWLHRPRPRLPGGDGREALYADMAISHAAHSTRLDAASFCLLYS